jgi:RNA polymerase sigma-70 factor (ECF subfamily)
VSVLVSDEIWQYLKDYSYFNDNIIEKLEADDSEKLIDRIIETLPEQCKEIFKLSKHKSLTNIEIAQQLNISVSTVKTQIYRALEIIREDYFK